MHMVDSIFTYPIGGNLRIAVVFGAFKRSLFVCVRKECAHWAGWWLPGTEQDTLAPTL